LTDRQTDRQTKSVGIVLTIATCAEVKPDSAEEVVADKPVEVPDGEFQTAILQL